MASLVPGYEYDIFISYRQKDNKGDRWVTEFVAALKTELEATFKEDVSIYFDENPHDGLLETHHVDKSLDRKLKCLILIPVISRTYCDPKSYAWTNEFLPFCEFAKSDAFGMDVMLANRNVASRVLPIQIHEIDVEDKHLFEQVVGGALRSIDFVFKSQGVNRPLSPDDLRSDNLSRTYYRDQINKTANAIDALIKSMRGEVPAPMSVAEEQDTTVVPEQTSNAPWLWKELRRRNIFRAALVYVVLAVLVFQLMVLLIPVLKIEEPTINLMRWLFIAGFPVAMLMAWFYEVSPDGFIRTTSEKAFTNPYPASRKKPLTGPLPITILCLLLVLQYLYFNYYKINTLLNAPIKSIAVLPFENRSDNPDDQYIADGITDDLLTNLSMMSRLKVSTRKSIQQYRGKLLSFDQIGHELDVMALVTGSVQRSGNKLVIRTSLIDATTNNFIWGNTLHRSANDIITVQSEIASLIAEQLEIELNYSEKDKLNKKPTTNATAYDYYLKGRSLYYEYNPEANRSAILQFKKAIDLDPSYARAWAGLGDAYGQMFGRFAGPYVWTDSSLMAATRAIQLDSTLSDAYKALAVAHSYKDEFEKATPLLLKAIELNPTNEQAIGNLGTNYLLRGELHTALYWQKKGVGLDPKNWIPYQLIGWIYRLLGDLNNAELWLNKSLELDPMQYDTYELLGYTYVAQGRVQDALNLLPRVVEIDPNETRVLEAAGLIAHFAGDNSNAKKYFELSIEKNINYKEDHSTVSPIGLGQILLEEGNKVEAEVYLNHATENCMYEINNDSKFFEPYYNLACIYAIRGNKEQSLQWLNKAIELHWVDYAKVLHGPFFSKFKTDPDFQQRVNFVRKKTETMLVKANAM